MLMPPRSTATTVLELLTDVKAAILREPKLADMGAFYRDRAPEDGGPSCGTVGCFAGWVLMMAGAQPQKMRQAQARQMIHHIDLAQSILGTDLTYTFGKNGHVFNAGSGDACAKRKPGSKGYAQAVADRIDQFIRRNGKSKLARRPISRYPIQEFL